MDDIEENEDVSFIWTPNNQFVLEKNDEKFEPVCVQEPEYEQNQGLVPEKTTKNTQKPDDEKLKHQKSVKFTDSEDEWITTLMIAMGTKNAAEAVRWCVRKVQDEYGEEVKKIAKKKARIAAQWGDF